jgi:large subunit ribosomal protein L23
MNMTKSPYDVITNLLMTEKSSLLKDQNKYAFRVSPRASKLEIADAVEKIYGVKVGSVNLMNYAGKPKRAGRSPVVGRRANWKKAVVTLSEGEIELA